MPMLMAAMMAISFTSCDYDDYYDDDRGYWYDRYDNYAWNNTYNYEYNSRDQYLLDLVSTLVGEWAGQMDYEYTNEQGQRERVSFDTNMIFYQFGSNSLSGNGVEIDMTENETQTLKFSWYIDEQTTDIYIKYQGSNKVFVMDANSNDYGYHLGVERGKNVDTFHGYMIGTGAYNDDVMHIDLEYQPQSQAKGTRAADKVERKSRSYGLGDGKKVIGQGERRLVKR